MSTAQTERASIAALSEELEVSDKSIRAFLRREFTRTPEDKNSRWGNAKEGYILTQAQTQKVRAHFTPAEEDEEATA